MAREVATALPQLLARLELPYAQVFFTCRCCHMHSWGRIRMSMAGCHFSPSIWCIPTRDHHLQTDISPAPSSDRNLSSGKLRRESFDPSQWWVHRLEKADPRSPNYEHTKTQQRLWGIDDLTSSRVKAELSTQTGVWPDFISKRRLTKEKRWREFFSDPSQWWDHRAEKVNPRYPDFKHKRTGRALWLGNRFTPPWVEAELATMPPALLQSHIFSWHVRLRRHVEAGEYEKTLHLFQQMQLEGMAPDKFTLVAVLNACSNLGSLVEGRRVHGQIIRTGCETDIYVDNCLVDMYAKCGSIKDAQSVFNEMPKHSVVSWNAIIGGYVKSEQGLKALELFHRMQQERVEPDTFTFVVVLNACASVAALEEGRRVHEQIIQRGCESQIYVANCLVDMYAKCRSIDDAWSVFNKMPERTVVSWTAMIVGYVKSEQGLKALELFREMQSQKVEPNTVTFVGVLNACASVAALEEGRRVHKQIIGKGCESDVYVATSLVDMYAKCGSLEDGWTVFNKMRKRNVVTWSAMIVGYSKSEQGLKALELFQKMQQEGVEPDTITFMGVLNACAGVAALEEGRRVHGQIIRRDFQSNVYVATCLLNMYAKCGSIEDAWSVFNMMQERDVVSWGAMIVSYVKSEQAHKALELFHKMQQEGVEPNNVTFVGALHACACVAALEEGRRIHKQIIRRSCQCDVYVANCLIDMYVKCGSIEDAWSVFKRMQDRSVDSWNAMIVSYVKAEQGLKALELFRKMQLAGVEPDVFTFVGVLNACASVTAVQEGKRVHEKIIRKGLESDVYVSNCLIDMYAKCGSIEDAGSVFDSMPQHSVVSWNVMIAGYVKSKQGLKALELFQKMQQEGVEPDAVTFIGVLNACASVVALEEGRHVHKQIIQRGCQSDVYVATCLVDMYAKCGSMKDAGSVFNKMRQHDVVSWSAMIGGYAMHGHSRKAIEYFKRMGKERVKINEITFVCLLSACSHGGLVEEGLRYFKTITSHYNVHPTREHYCCIVDLLGRAGWLEEAEKMAEEMMNRMPNERNNCVWMSLLGSCRIHGNIEMAERAARRCWELDPENASAHLLLLNIYAAAGEWDRGAAIRQEMLTRKVPGHTWMEVKNVVHQFVINEEAHPQLSQVHATSDRLSVQLNEEGYILDTRLLSPDETEKCHLYHQ